MKETQSNRIRQNRSAAPAAHQSQNRGSRRAGQAVSQSDRRLLSRVARMQGRLESQELLRLAGQCEKSATEFRRVARIVQANPNAWNQAGPPGQGRMMHPVAPLAVGGQQGGVQLVLFHARSGEVFARVDFGEEDFQRLMLAVKRSGLAVIKFIERACWEHVARIQAAAPTGKGGGL